MIRLRLLCASVLVFAVTSESAIARPGDRYQLEIAIVSSLSFVSEWRPDEYMGDWFGGGYETEEYLLIPGNSPSLRFTFWTRSPVLVDAGMMLIASGTRYNSAKVDRFMIEMGLGLDLGRGQSKVRPFIGALGGGIMLEDSEFRNYVGGQAGVRFFVKDYVAVRAQVGHRTTLGDDRTLFRATEIAAGIGFLL